MKRLYLILVLVFAILSSCKFETNDDKNGFKTPLLEEIIKGFINARKELKDPVDIFVVNLSGNKDSLAVEIANTYPNTEEAKFNYDTTIDGYRIIFTGKKIQGYFQENSKQQFPNDIVKITKEQRWLLFKDYTNWLFRYTQGKIIYYSPKEEIDQFVNIPQELRHQLIINR